MELLLVRAFSCSFRDEDIEKMMFFSEMRECTFFGFGHCDRR